MKQQQEITAPSLRTQTDTARWVVSWPDFDRRVGVFARRRPVQLDRRDRPMVPTMGVGVTLTGLAWMIPTSTR